MFNLENLNDEYFSQLDDEEILDIKNLSLEDKITCFKFFLTSNVIKNHIVILNIFTLLNGISGIDDDVLNDEKFYFSSLEEYVDLKLQLRDEINNFDIKLVQYYLGIIQGISVQLNELKEHIPNTYFNVLILVTPQLISRLMIKYLTKIDTSAVKPTYCAQELYNKINNPDSLLLGFVTSLFSDTEVSADGDTSMDG